MNFDNLERLLRPLYSTASLSLIMAVGSLLRTNLKQMSDESIKIENELRQEELKNEVCEVCEGQGEVFEDETRQDKEPCICRIEVRLAQEEEDYDSVNNR